MVTNKHQEHVEQRNRKTRKSKLKVHEYKHKSDKINLHIQYILNVSVLTKHLDTYDKGKLMD